MSRELEKEIHALRMKQSRIESQQRKANAEVWSRIEQLEQLTAQENNSGVDAAQNLSPTVQMMVNKVAIRRGWNNSPKQL